MSIGEKYGGGRGAGVTSLVNGISGIGAIVEGDQILYKSYQIWSNKILYEVQQIWFQF